jgi:predicted DNA-binding transcriptional regulator YafY
MQSSAYNSFFLFLFLQTSSCRLQALSPSIGNLLSERFVEEALSGFARITSIHRLTCQKKEDSAEIRTLLSFGKHIIVLQNIAPS